MMKLISSIAFLFALFFIGRLHITSGQVDDDACKNAVCGKGTCVPSGLLGGYDCVCDSGWRQFQLGFITFPPCVIPNCLVNLQCGNDGQPSAPPPPAPNPLDPCAKVWCGCGTCVPNGLLSYNCECDKGSTNMLNLTALACFNQFSFGGDCSGFGLVPLSPPSSPPPPPPPSNESNKIFKRSLLCAMSIGMMSSLTLIFRL